VGVGVDRRPCVLGDTDGKSLSQQRQGFRKRARTEPAIYTASVKYLSLKKRNSIRENALLLAREVTALILDHHMLGSEEGYLFFADPLQNPPRLATRSLTK